MLAPNPDIMSWKSWLERFKMLSAPMAVCDEEGTLVAVTDNAAEILNSFHIPTQVLPRRLPTSLWRRMYESPMGQPVEWHPQEEWRALKGSGERWLGCACYVLDASHRLMLMRDVSDKQRALSRGLYNQRLEVIGRLAATIAHDLRSPLASISYNIECLQDEQGPQDVETRRRIVKELAVATDRIKHNIEHLLLFSKLSPGSLQSRVDLHELTARVLGLLRPRIRAIGHRVETRLPDGLPDGRGNPLHLEQALVSLVENAIEASSEPLTIVIEARELRAGRLAMSISDTGPGISSSLRERIFEPFFSTKEQGTGLGLSIARDSIRAMHGSLKLIHSSSSSGAKFVVELPAWGAEDEEEAS